MCSSRVLLLFDFSAADLGLPAPYAEELWLKRFLAV